MLWVVQSTVRTDTQRNRTRTRYLDPIAPKIRAAIEDYFEHNPDGEKVTPHVFAAIDSKEILSLIREHGFGPTRPLPAPGDDDDDELEDKILEIVRRELGLRIPIELVHMYGEAYVETWRRKDGRNAAPRRASPRHVKRKWPKNYTPHRVRFDLLDTTVASTIELGESFQPREVWRSIFDSWFQVLTDYRKAGDDLGWWHNDSANVGLLAGAVWRRGGVCISEHGGKREVAPRPGGADLWFRLDGQAMELECTMVWPRTNDEFAGRLVSSRLDDAQLQLEGLSARDPSVQRYAACVVVPAVTGPDPDATSILDAVASGVLDDQTAIARYAPQGDPLADTAHGSFKYPAVLLVVRRVQ